MKIPSLVLTYELIHLKPRNYQVSKEVVHELEFGDVMQIYTICRRVTGILILNGSLGCFN